MTQAQFFQAVAESSQVAKAQVRAVFTAVEDVVMKRLKNEGKIPLGGLGAVKLVADVNDLTGNAADTSRSELLEVAIIFLILFEIVAAFR